ncbi:hypothetical protein B0H14DRAFT_2346753, partial [Mycena olivaceomarginata]
SRSLRSIERIVKSHNLRTSRHSGLTDVEKGAAIISITEEVPLGRWGARKIKEKLAVQSIHIPRDFIDNIRGILDRDATDMRKPGAKKIHTRGLHSAGPNEEWCVDGHEKILQALGIAVWGIVDKFSRYELKLWALPDSRTAEVPPALYLRLLREKQGMPLQTTSDKGSETGLLADTQTALRHDPSFMTTDLNFESEAVTAHLSVKSVYNITRERGWRPIWEKELKSWALVSFHFISDSIKVHAGPSGPMWHYTWYMEVN